MDTSKIKKVGTVKVKGKEDRWKKYIKNYGDTWYLFGTCEGMLGCIVYYLVSTSPNFFDVSKGNGVSGYILHGKEVEILEVSYDDNSG